MSIEKKKKSENETHLKLQKQHNALEKLFVTSRFIFHTATPTANYSQRYHSLQFTPPFPRN